MTELGFRPGLIAALLAMTAAAPVAGQAVDQTRITREEAATMAALRSRTREVRGSGPVCNGCLVEAIPIQALTVSPTDSGHCLENPVVERFQLGSEGRSIQGALLQVPVRTDKPVYARILLIAPAGAGTPPPATVYRGFLCLPSQLTNAVSFDPLGAEKDPQRGIDRGYFDAVTRILFGSDVERYSQIWVESEPAGAEIMIGASNLPERTNTTLALTREQLKQVWLRFGRSRYPLAACLSKVSLRARIAREYHCKVR